MLSFSHDVQRFSFIIFLVILCNVSIQKLNQPIHQEVPLPTALAQRLEFYNQNLQQRCLIGTKLVPSALVSHLPTDDVLPD